MKQEIKDKLSKALKNKWASGTRKKNPPETYAKSSVTQKIAFSEGRRKPTPLTSDQAKQRCALRDEKKLAEINRINGAKKKGVEKPPGPLAKGIDNIFSKYWILKSPDQQIIQGWNLNDLIRKNAHLFNPDDIVWGGRSKSICRASKGLRGLFEMKKDGTGAKTTSWKGWMIGDRREEEPNDRVEGRDAALSRRVPSHDGLCGNGSKVGAGDTAKG